MQYSNPKQNINQPTQHPTPLQNTTEPSASDLQPPTKEERSKSTKKPLLLILLLCLIAIILIAIIAILLLSNREKTKVDKSAADTAGEDDRDTEDADGTDTEEVDEPTEEDLDRIVYITDNNVWTVHNDGSSKKQITTDGSDTKRYSAIDWRSPGIVSYATSGDECKIYTKDIETEEEVLILTVPSAHSIGYISWSHDGNTLAYDFSLEDGSSKVVLWTTSSETILHTYASALGRGISFSDGLYAKFSPNDETLLVLNTFIDTFIDKPIMVFETDGTLLTTLTDATFPTFDGNDAFYFVQEGELKRWDLTTSSASTISTTAVGYDICTSRDRNFVTFWDLVADENTTLNYYDTAGSASPIGDNLATAKWLDDESVFLVAIRTSGFDISGNFVNDGLVKVERVDGTTVTLETENVYLFDIE